MRKRTIGIIAGLLAAFGVSSAAHALGTSDAYYITYDEFYMNNSGSDGVTVQSPYDSYTLGGGVTLGSISDNTDYAGTVAKRDMNKVTGKAVWELAFTNMGAPDETFISLRCGDADGIKFKFMNSELYAVTPSGNKKIENTGTFYGLVMYMDIDAGTYTIQSSGKTVGANWDFTNKVEYFDQFRAETPGYGTGNISLSAMRIHKEYLLNERFMFSRSNVPDDWKRTGEGFSTVNLTSEVNNNDRYSLVLTDNDFTGETGISHDIHYDSEGLWVEYQFLIPDKVGEFAATLSAGGKSILKTGSKNLDFGYWQDGNFIKTYTFRKNLWYNVIIRLRNGTADIYLNHKLRAQNVPVENVKIDNVKLATGKTATGSVYVDDITAKPMAPLPDNYPGEPVTPQKRDPNSIIAMQSCNIWREGTHFGWDHIAPYPERITALGLYDEGSIEARDWETKWMVEHGIDAEIYCWYRNSLSNAGNVATSQIKRPRNSYELNDAFLNSEYGDKMKFVLGWENAGTACAGGMEDWKNNVVPYWIEMYFMDSRYLVLDNKPVLALYQSAGLLRDFGDVNGVREAFEYLESELRKIGFDGAYFIAMDTTKNDASLQRYVNMGVDALYCYSWSMQQGLVPGLQKEGVLAQRSRGIIDIMMTVGMGRDDTPWSRTHGGFMTPESFEELLTWTRDVYMPSCPEGSFGRRMITLDNWNEYGEGHFMSPAGLYGFGYLDAIRKVFTYGDDEHDDAVPDDNAKERFNHLFVQTRNLGKRYDARQWYKSLEEGEKEEDITYDLLKAYNFDENESIDDYEIAKQIENFKMENGVISGTSNDTDPGFFIKNIGLESSNVKKIKARFRTNTETPKFQIYFITSTGDNWAERKSWAQETAMNGDFVEVTFDAGTNSQFLGVLTDIRIDPLTTTGNFEIDYIEFYGLSGDNVRPLYINGEPQYPQREVTFINDRMFLPAAELAGALGYSWCDSLDGKTLDMLQPDDGIVFYLEYGKDAFKVDGESYFPVRMLSEALGFRVIWDAEHNSANVITKDENAPVYDPDPPGVYNFHEDNNFQGLTNFASMTGTRVARDAFIFSATTNDSNCQLAFEVPAERYSYCNVRVKNKSAGNVFKIYFTTAADTVWNEAKSVYVTMSQSDSDYKTYTLNLASNPLWTGNITRLRIDMTDGVGDFAMDYMIFSDKPMEFASAAAAGGGSGGINILSGGIMDTKDLKYETAGTSAAYTGEEGYVGRYSLQLSDKNGGGYIRVPVTISEGNKYTVGIWMKAENGAQVKIGTYDASGALSEGKLTELPASSIWKSFNVAIDDDHGDAAGIYIMPGAETVYIDNLKLFETAAEKLEEKSKFSERTAPKAGHLKVLIIGNSITQHNPSDSLGWTGSWGMAATSEDKDYVHVLKSLAEKKDSGIEFKWRNISEFERNFYNFSNFNSAAYKDCVDYDADIIITAFGANINNAGNENDPTFVTGRTFNAEDFENIVNFFNPYGDAYVIAGWTPLTGYEIYSEMQKAAAAHGWPIVDMTNLRGDEYSAKPYKAEAVKKGVFTENVSSGVLGHPGDLGMRKMAEQYWEELEKAMDKLKR